MNKKFNNQVVTLHDETGKQITCWLRQLRLFVEKFKAGNRSMMAELLRPPSENLSQYAPLISTCYCNMHVRGCLVPFLNDWIRRFWMKWWHYVLKLMNKSWIRKTQCISCQEMFLNAPSRTPFSIFKLTRVPPMTTKKLGHMILTLPWTGYCLPRKTSSKS